jgi:predicted DNA-binding transcriptional regulator AlpA
MTVAPSIEAIRQLPAVLDVPTAGSCFGLSRGTSYELVRRGDFPAPVLKLGNSYRVPTAGILRALGIDPDGASPA